MLAPLSRFFPGRILLKQGKILSFNKDYETGYVFMNTLHDLPVGATARIDGLALTGGMRRRLLDIGMVRGTPATCLYESPSGDPRAYGVRGAVIALRREDAVRIAVC